MKKTILALAILGSLFVFQPLFAFTGSYQVKSGDIFKGYIVEKIWLTGYAVPEVTISGITYDLNVGLPKDAMVSDPSKIEVMIGMERKKPFAVVHIPAFTAGSNGSGVNQVTGFTLTVTEKGQNTTVKTGAKTTSSPSVLAGGTWYKIAVTKTGFYKIDPAVITAMGLNPSNINPANIRVFGNGGHMLSENNAIARADDLQENALLVSANGDNTFDNGEYAVFYAEGTTSWKYDTAAKKFLHLTNLYTDTAYYFITFDHGAGMRVGEQATPPASNVNVGVFDYYDVHEKELVNPATLGKSWYGESFNPLAGNTTQSVNFDLGTNVTDINCKVCFASTSPAPGSSFFLSLNNASIATSTFSTATAGDDVMDTISVSKTVSCNSSVANFAITFNASDASSVGYLDYIELNARRNLVITGDQMNFRDMQSVAAGKIAGYQLQGADGNTRVWDVTDPRVPVIMNGSLAGSIYTFTQDASSLHEFAAMNNNNFLAPKFVAQVTNQNLHGSAQVDLIIVTYPGFVAQAEQLAAYHRSHDNLRVIVATTDQVYNEFSSGAQDISAIRDFARMFYKRAGTDSSQMPRYLLLLGGASYDYKNRIANNSNFVPVFESAESLNDLSSFSSDDFYGFLDDFEYIENNKLVNALDIAVGRLPARNSSDATTLVNKIINYTSPATLGPWRITTSIVADKGCNDPAGNHMADGESMSYVIAGVGNNLYNNQKVYVDAIPTISTPAGARCPNANAAINQQVYKGTFLINYNGHGNPEVWSSQRILTQDDYSNWNNSAMLPFMVTATCDFGQFDHPQFVSAAEQLVLRNGGGVVTILTTTQAVYAYYNHEINVQYLTAQFTPNADGSWNTFGDAYVIGKNITYGKPAPHDAGEIANFRKFALLGDPALTPDFPKYKIKIDSVKDGFTNQKTDSVKALGAYVVNGSVRDNNGNVLTNFNGMVSISFFDKPRNITTISGCGDVFQMQDNIVYKGRVSVTNGLFTYTFITPKDINYYYGVGKISTYADNGITDAAGSDTSLKIGGYSDHPIISNEPPVVKPYINDSLFLNGGVTGTNTSLFVSIYDKTGINVSGNDIGHDLTAVLDDHMDAPYILNDYYETAPNTYQRGYVSFPINGLSDGKHSITVKAWDVNDNLGVGIVDFIVIDGKVMDIEQLKNYPNPFNNTTHFVFEHNHPNELLNVDIIIYNTSGSLVKNIHETFTPTGSRSNDITWDGTDNNGARLSSGVYVYRLNISTEKGYKSSSYQKLVIVR
jgi:Peptidase family C25/FlgD Ig-like domain